MHAKEILKSWFSIMELSCFRSINNFVCHTASENHISSSKSWPGCFGQCVGVPWGDVMNRAEDSRYIQDWGCSDSHAQHCWAESATRLILNWVLLVAHLESAKMYYIHTTFSYLIPYDSCDLQFKELCFLTLSAGAGLLAGMRALEWESWLCPSPTAVLGEEASHRGWQNSRAGPGGCRWAGTREWIKRTAWLLTAWYSGWASWRTFISASCKSLDSITLTSFEVIFFWVTKPNRGRDRIQLQ